MIWVGFRRFPTLKKNMNLPLAALNHKSSLKPSNWVNVVTMVTWPMRIAIEQTKFAVFWKHIISGVKSVKYLCFSKHTEGMIEMTLQILWDRLKWLKTISRRYVVVLFPGLRSFPPAERCPNHVKPDPHVGCYLNLKRSQFCWCWNPFVFTHWVEFDGIFNHQICYYTRAIPMI